MRIDILGQRNERNEAIAELLRIRGYDVRLAIGERSLLEDGVGASPSDLILVDARSENAHAAFETLRAAGLKTAVLVYGPDAAATPYEAAFRLDHPRTDHSRADFSKLLPAVEELLAARLEDREVADGYRRTYPSTDTGVEGALREVCSFLTQEGVAPAHRIRIASAVSELAHNVVRHAYPDGEGTLTVEIEMERTRVMLSVEDAGCGFDAMLTQLESIPAALPSRTSADEGQKRPITPPSGLDRTALLSEKREMRSGPEGTAVSLTFELTPVRFAEEPEDFSEVDYLDPMRMRDLLAALRDDAQNLGNLSPSLALTVGRLLGGLH